MCRAIAANGSEGGWMEAGSLNRKDYQELSEIGARLESKPNPDGPKITIKERQAWRQRNQTRLNSLSRSQFE